MSELHLRKDELMEILKKIKKASFSIKNLNNDAKNKLLKDIIFELDNNRKLILQENDKDIKAAKENHLSSSMIDRLILDNKKIDGMIAGMEEIIKLDDPCHKVLAKKLHQNGLTIEKVSVPFGVIAIIYESRPNVTADCAALCLKSNNACVLKGGKEALNSNRVLVSLIQKALIKNKLNENLVYLIQSSDRDITLKLMHSVKEIDLLIPRGSANLINYCLKNSLVPIIETGAGICHLYVDKDFDENIAAKVIINAKTSRPSVCNALETLLIHQDIAEDFIKKLFKELREHNVEIRGDQSVLPYDDDIILSNEYDREYLDLIIGVKVVKNVDEAIKHIHEYSTKHSETIITENRQTYAYFRDNIDAAVIYLNASSRFSDGYEFGLGAEIGISTQKMHARGPMGVNELTTYTYYVKGDGQIR